MTIRLSIPCIIQKAIFCGIFGDILPSQGFRQKGYRRYLRHSISNSIIAAFAKKSKMHKKFIPIIQKLSTYKFWNRTVFAFLIKIFSRKNLIFYGAICPSTGSHLRRCRLLYPATVTNGLLWRSWQVALNFGLRRAGMMSGEEA